MLVIISNPIRVEALPPPAGLNFWQKLFYRQRWKVLRDIEVRIGSGAHRHIVRVAAGLVTDFATVFRPFEWCFPERMVRGTGALVHDQLYKSGEVGKRISDAILAGLLVDCDGAEEWQAEIFFIAVHVLGFAAWRGHRRAKAISSQPSAVSGGAA